MKIVVDLSPVNGSTKSEAIEQGFIPGIYDFGRPPENVKLFEHSVDELAKHDAATE